MSSCPCSPANPVLTPFFYGLPKVHKPGPLKVRPITAAHKAPTTSISHILRSYLTPILTNIGPQSTILKNSYDLVHDLASITFNSARKPVLITFDIKDLYTNIILDKFKSLLHHHPQYTYLNLLISTIERNQTVQFLGKTYRQTKGIPMGDNASVEIANYYLFRLVDEKINNLPGVVLYKRYIDDGFAITHEPEIFLHELDLILNSIGLELSDSFFSSSVNFLDIRISIIGNHIETSLYQKPLNKFLYLPYSSAHPPHTLQGWITGELTRIKRICSTQFDSNFHKKLFYNRLLLRCYPRKLLDKIFALFELTTPVSTNSNKLPFVLPFSLRNLQPIKKVLFLHRKEFIQHANCEILPTWSVPKNLGAHLINNKD